MELVMPRFTIETTYLPASDLSAAPRRSKAPVGALSKTMIGPSADQFDVSSGRRPIGDVKYLG
jgi:hypothetical protein